jgi:hypothetical protein
VAIRTVIFDIGGVLGVDPPTGWASANDFRWRRLPIRPVSGSRPAGGPPTAPLAVALAVALARGYPPGRITGVTPVPPAPAAAPPEPRLHDRG